MQGRLSNDRGVSLVEVIVVTALIAIAISVSVVQMRSTIAIVDSDKASNLVSSQILYARQVAIAQRRNVVVSFSGGDEITVTRLDGGGVDTVMSTATLPSGFAFSMPDGVVDTPDAFGNAAPVDFETETEWKFLADGTFVNEEGDVMNGNVFTMSGSTVTARAVTLAGASGRIRKYRLEGDQWVE